MYLARNIVPRIRYLEGYGQLEMTWKKKIMWMNLFRRNLIYVIFFILWRIR